MNKLEIRYLDYDFVQITKINYDFKTSLNYFCNNMPTKSDKYYPDVLKLLEENRNKMVKEHKDGNNVVYMYYVDYPTYKKQYNRKIYQAFKSIGG